MFIFTTIFSFIAKQAIALFEMKMRILGFILDHWKASLAVAILAVSLIHYIGLKRAISSAKKEVVLAQKALLDHVNADKEAAKKREAENRLNAILAQKKTDALEAQHKAELSLIVQKGASHEIASKRTITHLRNELRERIEGYQAAGVLENDTDRLVSDHSDTALLKRVQEELATCKEAGAIAAADYNFCKGYVDTQQSIIGVSK
jgi:hypothetical protein